MQLVSIFTLVAFAFAVTSNGAEASLKDIVTKVKDTVKADVAKVVTKPPTKIIALDSNIVPTWNDVVPKNKRKSVKQITLKTVLNRWNKMESKSRDAYAALASTPMDKALAITKVTKFYDGSEACLKQHGKLSMKVNKKKFDMIMKVVSQCIDQTNAPPTFEVDVSATIPPVDDNDDDGSELDTGDSGGVGSNDVDTGSSSSSGSSGSGVTTPTMASSVFSNTDDKLHTTEPKWQSINENDWVSKDSGSNLANDKTSISGSYDGSKSDNSHSHSASADNASGSDVVVSEGSNSTHDETSNSGSYDGSKSDNSQSQSASTSDVVVSEGSNSTFGSSDVLFSNKTTNSPYVYNPALAHVAPFSALDLNGDAEVTTDEWASYVSGLHDSAIARVEKGKDERAKHMLTHVIEFHYSILRSCIKNNVGAKNFKDDAMFEAMVHTIESNCYVKFRYSLLSGPPPFQWIARRNATVNVQQVEAWFKKAVNTAKDDVKNKSIVALTPTEHQQIEHVMDCIYKVLGALTTQVLTRDLYYIKLDEVGSCVSSFAN